MADGSLIFDTRINTKGFESGTTRLESSAMGLIRKIGVAFSAGAIVKGLASVGRQSIALASDLEEVQNVVDVAFGDGAERINDWAEAAGTAFGLSELAAKRYVGTMGAMLKSMGLAEAEVAQMSTGLVGLAGDFASFYNITSDEAFAKIRAGISGETEPLKQLGINMSVANLEAYALSQGLEKVYSEMTQAEQVALRYEYLMSVTADAQGDFSRTSESLANQQRIASLAIENVGAAIGRELLPLATSATKAFGQLATGVAEAMGERGIRGGVDYIATRFPVATAAVTGLAAAYGSMLVINAVRKATTAYTTALAVLDALEKKNAITLVAVNGGLTAKQLLVGVLAGKLSIATAAQAAFNAVMSANPIGLAAAAIGALVGGMVLLDRTLRKTHPEMYELSNAIKDCTERNNELRKSMEESADAFDASIESAETEGVALDRLTDKLVELSSDYDGSVVKQRQMDAVCKELNGSITGLNLSYDEQTGALNMTEDALRGLIAQQKESARWNAVQERYTETLKQQADAEYNLYLAQKAFNAAKAAANSGASNGFGPITQANADFQRASVNLAAAESAMADASAAVTELEGYMGDLGMATQSTTAAVDENTEALAAEHDALVDLGNGVQIAQGMLDGLGITAQDAAERLDSLTDAATNMFGRINTESELSYEKMLENLAANTAAVEEWGNNMAYLAGKIPPELYDALAEAGPEEMAGAVNELASQTDFSELNALWAAGGEAAIEAFLQQLGVGAQEPAGVGDEMLSGIAAEVEASTTLDTAAQAAIKNAQEAMVLTVQTAGFDRIGASIAELISRGFVTLYPAMYSHGQNAMQGFINGMESKRQAIKDKVADLAKAASKTFTVKLQIQSPSKLFKRYGEYTVEGFVDGIERGVNSVRSAMDDFGSVVAGVGVAARGANVRPLTTAPAAAPAQTTNVTQNIYGMERSPATILREAIYLQERAVLTGV